KIVIVYSPTRVSHYFSRRIHGIFIAKRYWRIDEPGFARRSFRRDELVRRSPGFRLNPGSAKLFAFDPALDAGESRARFYPRRSPSSASHQVRADGPDRDVFASRLRR